MSGVTPPGAAKPGMSLDALAQRLIPRMVIHEVVSVGLVALAMFLLWDSPGSPLGSIVVVAVGVVAISRAWLMPGRVLQPVVTDTSTDPESAGAQMTGLAGRTMKALQLPTLVGFVAALLSWGWQPVMVGSLITIGGMTFLGPSRTRLAAWRDRMELGGGKTGL